MGFLSVLLAFAGLVLVLTLTDTVGADTDKPEDILKRFSTKLLLTIHHEQSSHAATNIRSGSLEIEEIYDQVKGLAKVIIVDGGRAERAELFHRAEDELYLETRYGLDGGLELHRCTANIGAPPTDGYYFELLQRLTQGKSRDSPGVLIGPSVFLHSAQVDLLARFRERSSQLERNSQTDLGTERETSGLRRRFIVEKGTGLVREFSPDGGPVEFRQTDYKVDRSPLLAQLASAVSYSRGVASDSFKYSIDYLEIDNSTMDHLAETNRDLFRLPQVRACLQEEPPTGQFGFESTWTRYFKLRSTRFSMNVHAHPYHPLGIHVAADTDRHLMRFDIDKQSRNVIDLKHEFIYHMPLEPAGPEADLSADHEPHLAGAAKSNRPRNSHCSLISSHSFPGLRTLNRFDMALVSDPGSANRWAHLIGRPQSVVYLGLGGPGSDVAHRAHGFELSYSTSDNLPPFFVLLFGQDEWRQSSPQANGNGDGDKQLLLVGKLWLRADQSTCSQAHNSHRPLACVDPTPVRIRLDLVSRATLQVITTRQVQLTEFEWELADEDGLEKLDKIHETFDRRSCPIEKLELKLEVSWNQEIEEENFKPGEEFCQHRGQLDDLVFGQLNEYLLTYASFDVELMDLKLEQALAGTMLAEYSITLSELPDLTSSFKRIASGVAQSALQKGSSHLLARASQFKVLFECLSWASQFGNSHAVLHSPEVGCLVYDKLEIDPTSLERGNNSHSNAVDLFAIYERTLDSFSKPLRNSLSGLKLFKSDHIDAINHELVRSNRDENGFEACLARPTGQSLVRDIKFGKLRQLPASSSSMSTARQQVPMKSGFKFVETGLAGDQRSGSLIESRRQFEVVSLSDCARRCNEQPDCASYSHCKNAESQHQYCQLSDLKLSPNISRSLDSLAGIIGGQNFSRQSGCQLHSKDYLLYFEAGRGSEVLELTSAQGELPEWSRLAEGDISELDCASHCLRRGPDCMRFLHCRPHACYYRGAHPVAGASLRVLNPDECSLFKRKSLGLYRRVASIDRGPFNWTLAEPDGNGQLRAEPMRGPISEESCAQLCTDNAECQSFDSCSTAIYSKTGPATNTDMGPISLKRNLPHFVCTLLSHSLANGLHLSPDPTSTNSDNDDDDDGGEGSVELSKHCSHFERLGAESTSKLLIEMLSSNGSDSSSRLQQRTEPSADSKAIGLFSAALLGLALGVGANFLASFVLLKSAARNTVAANSRPR